MDPQLQPRSEGILREPKRWEATGFGHPPFKPHSTMNPEAIPARFSHRVRDLKVARFRIPKETQVSESSGTQGRYTSPEGDTE